MTIVFKVSFPFRVELLRDTTNIFQLSNNKLNRTNVFISSAISRFINDK